MSEKTFGKTNSDVRQGSPVTSNITTEKISNPAEIEKKEKIIPPGFAFKENDDPIIIFYGQTKCGKTTALVRLIKYLRHEYKLTANISRNYHIAYSKDYNGNISYEDLTQIFYDTCEAPISLTDGGTNYTFLCNIEFNHSHDKSEKQRNCRILEAQGEHLFPLNPANTQQRNGKTIYKNWLADIITGTKFKRIWVFFMDPSFIFSGEEDNSSENQRYVDSIKDIADQKPEDKFIFLINKCDKIKLKRGETAESYLNENYDKILEVSPFLKHSRILNLPRKNYSIIEFCAIAQDERRTDMQVGEGSPVYPRKLWDKIQELITQ